MKKDRNRSLNNQFFVVLPVVLVLLAVGLPGTAMGAGTGDDTCQYCHEFGTSLHHSARGMEYWYAADNPITNGLELITGYAYREFEHATAGCKNCHAKACYRCHGADPEVDPYTPAKEEGWQPTCLQCHARESAMLSREATQPGNKDVHRALDTPMECLDCHVDPSEVHGDGVNYISLRQRDPDAIKTRCEDCHEAPYSHSHIVHTGKLECKACHQRRVVSCYNCHMDTAGPDGAQARKAYGQIDDWVFLVNYDGKVTSANMQTFVGGDPDNFILSGNEQTCLMFAPVHSHSIMSPGRLCEDCHATSTVKKIVNKGRLNLTWLEGSTLMHQSGVIPVAQGTKYKFVSFDKDNFDVGSPMTWYALDPKPKPANLKAYGVGYGTPLTPNQMNKLKIPMSYTP